MTTKAQQVINLWQDAPPTNNELTNPETQIEGGRIVDVSKPSISVFLPDVKKNTGKAVVICPGGGYGRLAFEHEGTQVAEWLSEQGIAGIVLKYRMPNKQKTVPMEDLEQAFRIVKKNAKTWAINEDKIGVMGFSAGGHLAASASTLYKSSETRPAFSVLFYPVVNMDSEYTHVGSRTNLLGDNPSSSDLHIYSLETQVKSNTPPTILLLSDDDKSVPSMNSAKYYESLKKNDVPATMYIFPSGGHGWGMRKDFKFHDQMLILLKTWLEDI